MKKLLITVLLLGNFNLSDASQYWLSKPSRPLPGAANGASGNLQVSANGRYLSFGSQASNWVNGDVNGGSDIFVHDFSTGITQLASTTSGGQQISASSVVYISQVSDDGQTILMLSNSSELPAADGNYRVYSKNLNSGQVVNESEYNGGSYFDTTYMFMSADGTSMYFTTAQNIDPLHTSPNQQVYVKNLSNSSYTLISDSADGLAEADDNTFLIGVSPNNRYVLLRTTADNLLGTPLTNTQLVLKDLSDGSYELISQQPNGDPTDTNDQYTFGYVSNSGTVAFKSGSTDLVNNDTNMEDDLFIYQQDQIERITVSQSGSQVNNPVYNYFAFSGDGQTVVFVSKSDELIPGLNIDPSSNSTDPVFKYDVSADELTVLTANGNEVSPGRVYALALSQDGEFWLSSTHTELPGINVLIGDEYTGVHYQFNADQGLFTRPISVAYNPNTIISDMYHSVLTADQRWVLTATRSPNLIIGQDSELGVSLLLLDRYLDQWHELGRNVRFSSIDRPIYDMSASGRFVVFQSSFLQPGGTIDLGPSQIFLLDRDTNTYAQITSGSSPKVNDEGKVVFSTSDSLVNEDQNSLTDIYLYDSSIASLTLVSKNPNTLNAGNNSSTNPDIGGTGTETHVVFESRATDLMVTPDVNSRRDVFVSNVDSGNIQRASEIIGVGGDGDSTDPSISNQGNAIVFKTRSENLTSDDYNGAGTYQILHYDIGTATNTLASFNQASQPLIGSLSFRDYAVISDSGRFAAYSFKDNGVGLNFTGDDDSARDIIFVDMVMQESSIISDSIFIGYNTDEASYPIIAENDSHNPPLVGVAFNSGRILSFLSESPGHRETYMYQQGGEDSNIAIQIQGLGTVTGSLGVNCQGQCDYDFSIGSSVSLVAIPSAGQAFHAWQDVLDSCDTENPACQVDIDDRPRALTAIFLDENDLIFDSSFD